MGRRGFGWFCFTAYRRRRRRRREVPRWGSGLEGILLGEWRLRFDKTMVIYCFCTCGECHSQKVEKLLPKYGYEGNLDPLFPFCSAEID